MSGVLKSRDKVGNEAFVAGRNPTVVKWAEMEKYQHIYDNCAELLNKFFPKKPTAEEKAEAEKIRASFGLY